MAHELQLALLLLVCFLAGLGAGMMLRGRRESSLPPAAVLSLSPAPGVPAVGAPAVASSVKGSIFLVPGSDKYHLRSSCSGLSRRRFELYERQCCKHCAKAAADGR